MSTQAIIQDVVNGQLKTDIPRLDIGDTIDVHTRIIEGDKERIQVYQGVLIARRGSGLSETITVRRIVDGQGVERIFPIHSPRIARFEVVRHGDARRAKLYFLRGRVGKSRRLRDRRRGMKHLETGAPSQRGAKAKPAPQAKTAKPAEPAE